MQLELRAHQSEAIQKMHNGCVLWGDVGTGKTITALSYALLREAGKHIVVVTTAKKRDSWDWQNEAALLGVPHDGIEVTSWNRIAELTEREGQFFLFDEQRLVGTGAWVKSFYKIAERNSWIVLSATPGDTWSDYAPLFIANGWYKNITEFRREHAVYSRYTQFPKIEKYIGQGKLQRYRKQLLVEMPMARHTTRHMHYIDCEWDQSLLDLIRKRRWNPYTDEPIKSAAEMYTALRRVVSTDPSRGEQLRALLDEHPRLIIFYNFNYELEILRSILEQHASEWDGLTTMKTPCDGTGEKSLPNPSESSSIESSSEKIEDSPCLKSDTTASSICPIHSKEEPCPERPVTASKSSSKRSGAPIESFPKSSENERSSKPADSEWMGEAGASETFGWSEWNGHKHEPIPPTDRWAYLVQYTSGSEGWNCISTDRMVFWSLTYSFKQFWQAQGRIDRMNTPYSDLHYYVLMTGSYAEKPVIRALKMKKDFQPK